MPRFTRLRGMQKALVVMVALVLVLAGGSYLLFAQPHGTSNPPGGVACTMEAKLCPDGVTYVGRQGPNCEFAACPASTTTQHQSATVTLKLGERKEVLGIFITPVVILEDSRCAIDVQCIQAGTVRVKMKVETGMGIGDLPLTLNEMGTTETEEITLTAVTPSPRSTQEIRTADYRLTFTLKKRI